jgi:hypothetical protein
VPGQDRWGRRPRGNITGETLVVAVQSARRELVLNADVVRRFRPRATVGSTAATPALSPTMTSFSARTRGANANSVGGEERSGDQSSYVYDTVNTDEASVGGLPQN